MIDSLDAKITQYVYAIVKLQHLIRLLRRIQARENKKDLPLVQYIALLGGNLFAIADLVLAPRLDHIYNYRLYHQNPLTISLAASHIPYDAPDIPVTLLATLPDPARADKCLRLFEGMCIGSLQGYQKKLHQAKLERMASFNYEKKSVQPLVQKLEDQPNDGTLESPPSSPLESQHTPPTLPESPPTTLAEHISNIEKVVEYYFNSKDIDCAVSNQHFTLNLPLNLALLHNEDFIEATLIDMDLRTLTYLNLQLQDTLKRLRLQSDPYVGKSKTLALNYYTLHHILALSLRLNDLYTVFRRTGRKCYFLNSEHLYDQKLFQQLRGQATQFKIGLQNADSFFSASKKNGTLIATLTRFFRQDARYESNANSVNDLSTFIAQGLLTMEVLSRDLGTFLEVWLITELRFRRNYGLPKKILTNLYNLLHNADEKFDQESEKGKVGDIIERKATEKGSIGENLQNGSTDAKNGHKSGVEDEILETSNGKVNANKNNQPTPDSQILSQKVEDDNISVDLEPFSTPEGEKTISLNALDINSLSPPSSKSPSRSSSINSNSGRAKLNRRISPLASPVGNIKPTSGSPSVSRSNSRRSSLIFSLSNLLLTSLPTLSTESKEPEVGRRRSNSQPTKLSDAILALSGASSATRSLRLPSGSLRLPSGSLRLPSDSLRLPSGSLRLPSGSLRLPSGSLKQTLLLRNSSAQKPLNNVQKQLLSVQEEHQKDLRERSQSPEIAEVCNKETAKLSANQRFQQHIKNASKQGFLTTQHREEMTSVVYDPNLPRSINFRSKQRQEGAKLKPFTSIGESQLPAAGVSSDFSKLGNGLSASGLGGNGSTTAQTQTIGSPTNAATRPTRAQVTKLNTRRNSVSIAQDIRVLNASLTDQTSVLSDSTSSSGHSKKVRFTGVPEWTEAEDKPSSYSTRILKNFAVFKTPSPHYKKKDQILKKDKMLQEESLSFKHLNGAEEFEQPDQVLVADIGSPASGKVRRLKKLL